LYQPPLIIFQISEDSFNFMNYRVNLFIAVASVSIYNVNKVNYIINDSYYLNDIKVMGNYTFIQTATLLVKLFFETFVTLFFICFENLRSMMLHGLTNQYHQAIIFITQKYSVSGVYIIQL